MSLVLSFTTAIYGSPLYQEAVALREQILRQPLGLKFTNKDLKAEKEHIHVIGVSAGRVCVTAALVPEFPYIKMQRVAVSLECQNCGLGSALLAFCENWARDQAINAPTVMRAAQLCLSI